MREKISAALKGRPLARETADKIGLANAGRKQSADLVAKRIAGREGYRHSDETREKIRAAHARNRLKRIPKTDESRQARRTADYAIWREAVFTRDEWTCQKCGEIGGYLHPHHIRNFAANVPLRFSVDNGITLCLDDHRLFHKTYGRKNNTPEQIAEYTFK